MSGSTPRRILVIDDSAAVHLEFAKIFGAPTTTFSFESAYQGDEGVNRVRAALAEGLPYAVAFVDLRMPPGWDGIETLTRLWEVDAELQVVLCTAAYDDSLLEMMEKAGLQEGLLILKKPFAPIEVLQMAHTLSTKWLFARQLRERRDAEAERRMLEVQLRHAQKMESIGQLAAGIAHEINTPTQYIGDNTHFLRDAFLDLIKLIDIQQQITTAAKGGEDVHELIAVADICATTIDLPYLRAEVPKALEQSLAGVANISRIVSAMKEFSHPGGHEKAEADLNRAIDSTITVATNEWRYVATVQTDFAVDLPPVPCHLGEFNQVILNMIVNATHAIEDVVGEGHNGKGVITISTRRVANWVEVRVADTGAGIPDNVRGRIFDPFFTTKGVGRGTGQGLAIAHAVIVDKHRGSIQVESELGKGTVFIVRLPLEAARTEKNAA